MDPQDQKQASGRSTDTKLDMIGSNKQKDISPSPRLSDGKNQQVGSSAGKGATASNKQDQSAANFAPKWDLLIEEKKEESRSGDEGDVGSTRQDKTKQSRVDKRQRSSGGGAVTADTKQNWIKATYGGVTKRLLNVSISDLDELKIALWTRFGALRDQVNNPGSLILAAELPKSEDTPDQASEMPLDSTDDLASLVYLAREEQGVCPRFLIRVDPDVIKETQQEQQMRRQTTQKKNIFNKKMRRSRSPNGSGSASNSQENSMSQEDRSGSIGGAGDERMSWGLHFYEQQDIVNRAHFPEYHVQEDRKKADLELDSDEDNAADVGKSVVDWKFNPPNELKNVNIDVFEEEYGDEEEDPFQQPDGRDVFHEQRMLQDRLDSRPERVTYAEAVDRSSQQASVQSHDTDRVARDTMADDILAEVKVQEVPDDFDADGLEFQEMQGDDKEDGDNSAEMDSEQKRRRDQRRILKKKKKNNVGFKYNVKLAKIPQKKDWGSWLSGMFMGKKGTSIKDLAYCEHVPEQDECERTEYHTTVQAGQTAFIQFKVFNRTENDWDAGCFLINDFEGGRQENFFEISKSIQSNHMFYLEIQIYIPAIVQEQLLQVKFQFVTPRFRPFGERMTAKINIVQDGLQAADVLSSRESVGGAVSINQSTNDPLSMDHINNISVAKKQMATEAEIFQMACELSDQGFGDFDLCLTVLTAKKGNKALAKNALSKVIFSKQKNSKSVRKPQEER